MENKSCSVNNIYQLEGRVPLLKAIPFGLQHILAMFVANLTPITIIAAAGGLSQAEIAILLQNAMFIAGIATLIQLYPVWKIGSGLPIVMGVSFTFVTVLCTVAANYGYPAVMGAVLVGGIFEGTLGLLAKYWRKLISPIVAASVVTAIGMSLFTVGARSFGGGYTEDFGSAQNLLLGTITLAVCLGWNCFAKGYLKQLSVLVGLIVGYIVAIFMGKVDLSVIFSGGVVSLPKILPYTPEFHAGAIVSVFTTYVTYGRAKHDLEFQLKSSEQTMVMYFNTMTIKLYHEINLSHPSFKDNNYAAIRRFESDIAAIKLRYDKMIEASNDYSPFFKNKKSRNLTNAKRFLQELWVDICPVEDSLLIYTEEKDIKKAIDTARQKVVAKKDELKKVADSIKDY